MSSEDLHMITASIPVRIAGGRFIGPIFGDFAWNPEDPLALTVTFRSYSDESDRVTWTVGRDLLAVGAVSATPHGLGDVKVRRAPDGNTVILRLENGFHQHVLIPALPLNAFLVRVEGASGDALDAECILTAIDAFIESIREEKGQA